MSEQSVRVGALVVLGGLYVGLLGYSVFGGSSPEPHQKASSSSAMRTVPPRVLYHDDDVDVYGTRSVRSGNQRGGGVRAGK